MDARAILFGSALRVFVTSVFGVGLLVGGAFFTGMLGVPGVTSIDNGFGAVNETDTVIETELVVHNPNPIGVRLGGLTVDYDVSMNGIEMASGEKQGLGISKGNTTIGLETHLQNDRIPEWWASHVKNGEVTNLTVTAKAHSGLLGRSATFQPPARTVRTDIISQFNSSEDRPVNADLPAVEDPVLVIRQTNASWGEVTDSETPIDIRFDVYNPKTTPAAVTNVGYNITMNDVLVGQGETEETESIPGRTTRTLETPTVIDNENLDEWWVSHLERNQTTELRIDFYAEVEVPGGETVRVPLDELTYTRTIETDMFGNKGDADAPGGDQGDAEDDSTTDDGSTTAGDSTTEDDSTTDDGTTTDGATTEDGDSTTTDSGKTTTNGDSTTTDGDQTTTDDDGLLARGTPPQRYAA